MIVSYDPLLVTLSIAIAILGSFAGLQLARRLVAKSGTLRKAMLSGAAVTIGAGIWSMHFVGMLAVSLPVTINYDILLTLVSALLAILMTGLGLFIAQLRAAEPAPPGLGRSGDGPRHLDHALRRHGRCARQLHHRLSVRSGDRLGADRHRGLRPWPCGWPSARKAPWQTFAAAAVMGLAISGMHYTAMAAASFMPVEVLTDYAAPALSPHLLAIVVALAAFLIFGLALLIALPDRPTPREQDLPAAKPDAEAEPEAAAPERLSRLPVERNKTTILLELDEIVSIQADAHYTRIYDGRESYFCSYALSELEAKLDPAKFLRVHRSHIINLRHAKAFERRKEQGLLRLTGASAPSVPVSRRNVSKLEAALGLRI